MYLYLFLSNMVLFVHCCGAELICLPLATTMSKHASTLQENNCLAFQDKSNGYCV